MRIILLIIFLILLPDSAVAGSDQDSILASRARYDTISKLSPVSFEKSKFEEYRKLKDFEYLNEIEQDSSWTRFKRWFNQKMEDFFHWLFGDYEANAFLMFIFSMLPYIFLAILLGFIIWLFIRLNPGRSFLEEPEASEVYMTEEEELIQSRDLPMLIQDAIEKGQYRLAVRYYYLKVLQSLDEQKLIEYRFQKTNADYTSEIGQENIKDQFKRITRIYDFIWYGDFTPSEEEFRMAEKGFSKMNTLINRPVL
ncbi:DUF4129 domain-containing protein [Salegentibacter chungangensis]|uniref:DUF4129 domain-containing protein n=1 Tax=Salegentibacter chungangensis TaxID=1335724 RepID=A0ABW3NSM5_9FLAO